MSACISDFKDESEHLSWYFSHPQPQQWEKIKPYLPHIIQFGFADDPFPHGRNNKKWQTGYSLVQIQQQ
ncbi:rCG37162 [Rattus norvegicus]|uniref:RCG37162 n=1 Tax=Rattus norvegicus TaxID=10116 RepID=A6HU23_RAT|nr:rCG37162 [Rattus norvegicus]